ncbi:MAG TPA: NADPH-dependent F420 reductase [Gemmatimonadaceae bacterium]|nr:NADPH-dependent F420 reductase [Gemmatimonadaceae bacterium]
MRDARAARAARAGSHCCAEWFRSSGTSGKKERPRARGQQRRAAGHDGRLGVANDGSSDPRFARGDRRAAEREMRARWFLREGAALAPAFTSNQEETRMNIGIIGAGNIGGTLTRRLTALGHNVSVANSRGPESLSDLTAETGAHAVTAQDAARHKDLVIVTIPERHVPDLPRDLFADADGTVVVDTGNYYPKRDGRIDAIESGTPESAWVSQQLGRPVVKAFNNIYAQHLMDNGRPAEKTGRIALPVAGDNPADKQVVMNLVNDLGFDPVDAGTLADSWRQQPGTPVYATDHDADGVRRALAAASPERTKEFRA